MTTDNNDTFYKVTNKDIYMKLEQMDAKLSNAQSQAKKAQVLSTTAVTLAILTLGYLISHLVSIGK